MKDLGKWRCNFCSEEENVINGVCPKCGPTQTTPLDDVAKKRAGVAGAEKARIAEIKASKEARIRNAESIEAGQ